MFTIKGYTIGPIDIALLITIILKLLGILKCSWIIALIPLWIGISVGLILVIGTKITGKTYEDICEELRR